MKGKNAAKPLINKVFLCSVIWKIRHGNGFENKDEKAYLHISLNEHKASLKRQTRNW